MDSKTLAIIILSIFIIIIGGYWLYSQIQTSNEKHDLKIQQDAITNTTQTIVELIFLSIQQQGYVSLNYQNQTLVLVPYVPKQNLNNSGVK